MPNELKPCPLCGGKVELEGISFAYLGASTEVHYAKIQCQCGLTFEKEWERRTTLDGYVNLSEDIITAWNRRVDEVVRCKDCEFFSPKTDFCRCHDTPIYEDDFCSYGERKE